MISRIKNNIKYSLTRFTLIVSIVFGLISEIPMFIDQNTIGIDDTKDKVVILLGILILCGSISMILSMFFVTKNHLLKRRGRNSGKVWRFDENCIS